MNGHGKGIKSLKIVLDSNLGKIGVKALFFNVFESEIQPYLFDTLSVCPKLAAYLVFKAFHDTEESFFWFKPEKTLRLFAPL